MTRALILVASAFAAFTATDVYAGGVVTNCTNDTEFSNKLVGGGTITFNCGTATIVLSSTKTIADFTTIDGGDKITLSGDNARRLFIVNLRARLELDNIVIEKGLSKGGDGGAIYNLDTVSISNSTFRNNATTSEWRGGAIYSNSHLAMNNTVFSSNEAGSGGAISVQSSISQTNIFTTNFDGNFTTNTDMTAGFGGALLLTDGATATVTSSTFSHNEARMGGAVDARSGSHLFIDTSSINDNSTTRDGGGIDVDGSTAMLSNATMSGNWGSEGGAITTFGGEMTLTNVTLSGNGAYYGAGYNTFLGTHTFTNVTISGNTAQSSGGGIYNSRGTMTLTNVTLAGNSGGNGLVGGIVNSGGGPDPDLKLTNVVIGRGTTGDNCQFGIPPTSSQFNLSDDATCDFGAGRDNVNLLLGPLAGNPGFTKTHLPGPGSPAIDNGTNAGCPSTDQRGVSRPQGVTCDVGAVEVVPATPTPTRTRTATATKTPLQTATPTQMASPTTTLNPTTMPTATISNTPTRTFTVTYTATPTATHSPTTTPTATVSKTPTRTSTVTHTTTPTATRTPTTTPTATVSNAPTHTFTVTHTVTPAATLSPTTPPTATVTAIASQAPTGTPSVTSTPSATATPNASATGTAIPTPSATPTALLCVGDCHNTGEVTVDDLVIMINVALEQQPLSACRAADVDRSGTVTIQEILLAVNNALEGCPRAISP